MREEVLRILRLVEQGRLRPEEAMSLIEALGYDEDVAGAARGAETTTSEAPKEEKKEDQQTRPPTSEAEEEEENFFLRIGRTVEESFKGLDWKKFGEKIKTQAKRGIEEARRAIDDLEKGGWRVGFPWGHEVRAEHQLTFNVIAGQTVQIEIPLGDVQIEGGFDGGRIEADVSLRGSNEQQAQERAQKWTLMVEQTEQGVVIRAPEQEPPNSADVDLNVQIPTGVHVKVRTVRGDLAVRNTEAQVDVYASQGDVDIKRARGRLHAETTHGDVSIDDFQGESLEISNKGGDMSLTQVQSNQVIIRTAAGDISASGLNTQNLTAETMRGDVAIELIEPLRGNLNLTSVSGDISLELPDGSDCKVSLDTVVGDVACDLPAREVSEKRTNRWTGICGEGTGQLKANTVHGDVSVSLRTIKT